MSMSKSKDCSSWLTARELHADLLPLPIPAQHHPPNPPAAQTGTHTEGCYVGRMLSSQIAFKASGSKLTLQSL